ncbi:MAG TPA: BppU family phage baseplate upper protein, partial [Negativicutes bacterium]|nr:BppU family phage baseplate upper protein [Negativicutes bacterium]
MPSKVFDINLDLIDSDYQLVDFQEKEIVSGDTDTNIFNINLLQNFVPVNATGNTAVIVFLKPDRTTVYQNLTTVNAAIGKYSCILSSQTIIVSGEVKAEVVLYEGTKKLTSTRFKFTVKKPLLDEGTVESSNEFSALTKALAEVGELLSDPPSTVTLPNISPVVSINAKVNSGLNFEMTAKPLLVNLLGADGDCEVIAKWNVYAGIGMTLD